MLPLYQNIKNRRLELKMSQQELADKVGYKSRSAINKIELGINDLTQSKIMSFAKALDTTVSQLMGWTEDSNSTPSQPSENGAEHSKLLKASQNTRESIDSSNDFFATDRERKIIEEYRTKPSTKNAINQILSENSPNVVTKDETLMFALYGDDSEDITPDMLDEVRNFAKYVREQRKKARE